MEMNLYKIRDSVQEMKNSCLQNYVIAGLDSYLVGGEGFGKVRLFENARDHQDSITPHSHRFDFTCLVLKGTVTNRVWTECKEEHGDQFAVSTLKYTGEVGVHEKKLDELSFWRYDDFAYSAGHIYSMKHDEVHSIIFGKGCQVLFFEGPDKSDESIILEPYVNNTLIPTYRKESYMFNPVVEE